MDKAKHIHMTERATPETDAAEFSILQPDNDNDISAALAVPSDLSRKLERQRDELVEALEYWIPDESKMPLLFDVSSKQNDKNREHWSKYYDHCLLLSRIRHSEG